MCDYETEAMRHNLPVTTAIDSLQQIYCTENPLFVAARSVGLQLVNSNSTLKNFIMSAAASSKITWLEYQGAEYYIYHKRCI